VHCCNVQIDDFIHGTRIISQICAHDPSLWYVWEIQEVGKHSAHDLGAKPRHGPYEEDYGEGGGEIDTIVELQQFGEHENWLGSLVGGQPYDLDFGLSEDMEALDVRGKHLGSQGIDRGLYGDDEEEYKFDDLRTTIVVWCGLLVLYVYA